MPRWLGAQDIGDAPGEEVVKLEEDSRVWNGSGSQGTLSVADEHPMGKFGGLDNNEGVSADHHGSVDQGRLDALEHNGPPDRHAVGVQVSGGTSPSVAASPDEVRYEMLNRLSEGPPPDDGTKDHSRPEEMLSNGSTNHHEVKDHSSADEMLTNGSTNLHEVKDLSGGSTAHYGIEEVRELEHLASSLTPGVKDEKKAIAAETDKQEKTQVFGSEIDARERQVYQESQGRMVKKGGDVQLQPVNGNGKYSLPVVYSNGHDIVRSDKIAGFKEDEDAKQYVNDHLSFPDHNKFTGAPEVHAEKSVPTIYTRVGGGHEIHAVRKKDDLDTHVLGDDQLGKEAVDVKSTVKTEPGIFSNNGRPIVLAKVVRVPGVMDPTLSRTDLRSQETEIEKRDVEALEAVARAVTVADKAMPKHEPSQDSSLETQKDTKTNGIVSVHSSEQKQSKSGFVEGTSIRESPSKENIKTENGGRAGPLEESPKWMNSGMIISQDEGDTFTSVQKYWAGMTGSEFLLVEGKRSPSFGSSENIGFPSFRNGDGRRSPSPFSLSKSGDGGAQSSPSLVSLDSRSSVEEKSSVPSFAVIHDDGSSSSSAHVDYDLERVVHEQNTHDLICPVCGSDVTKRIVLRKRKRTPVLEDHERVPKAIIRQPGGRVADHTSQIDESDDETWGCLACLSLFIRRVRGGEGQTLSASGEPVETEQERSRCLQTLFHWKHAASRLELQVPLFGDTAGQCLEPALVNTGHVRDVPVDDSEEVSCFSYLQRSKSSDTSVYESNVEIAKPMPVSTAHGHEVPPDENDRVSCFSYLRRSKQDTAVNEEATEESSISNCHAEIQDEAPSIIEQAAGVGEYGEFSKDPESIIQQLDGIGVSQQRETEKEKCECLPFFSFRSESSISVSNVTGTGSSSREFHPVEDLPRGGTSESLPASVPALPWGTSSKYDLPPSPRIVSSHQENISVIDRPEQATTSLLQPQALEESSDKRSSNCLPNLLPGFSWGPIPAYTNPSLDSFESAEQEQDEVPTAVSPIVSVKQEHRAPEDSSEKRSCDCLPDLLPAFSWGSIPMYTYPALDTDVSVERGQVEERTAVSTVASETREPQALDDSREKSSCNCLPDLLPALSWGPIPVYTHLPLDTDESAEREQVSPIATVTQEPRTRGLVEEKGTCNRLPEVPTFSWRTISRNDAEIQSAPQAASGRIDEFPVDVNEDLRSSHLKEEAKESATCACLPILLPAFHWGFYRTTHENALQEPLIPQDPPASGRVLLDKPSTDRMQTTEATDPGVQRLAVAPVRPDTFAWTPWKPNVASIAVTNDDEKTQITESEHFHIEGFVFRRETSTDAKPCEKPADAVSFLHAHQSNNEFAVDIKDGHIISVVEKIKPELLPENISSGNAVSSSTHLSAGASDEAEQTSAEINSVIEGDVGEIKHRPKELADLKVEENVAGSFDAVYQSVQTILTQNFPAEELVDDQPKNEHQLCNCFPVSVPIVSWWGLSIDSPVGGREEDLQDESNSVDMSLSTTHVELQRGQPLVDGTRERCNCLPSFPKFSLYDVFRDHHVRAEPRLPVTEDDGITTPLFSRFPHKPNAVVEVERTETCVAVEGATSAQAAAEAIAIAQGQTASAGDPASSEYLKSIVHGGLDITLVSLGVVASGAGGDAKTITVIAIGLANLLFGLLTHLNTLISLYYNNPTQFQQEVGQGFIQGCLSSISFLFFGALSPVTYGFSFRNATSKNYKFAATCLVALASIVVLGKASAHVKSKSAVRVISMLIVTGFLATIAGYETGNLVAKLLEQFGFDSV